MLRAAAVYPTFLATSVSPHLLSMFSLSPSLLPPSLPLCHSCSRYSVRAVPGQPKPCEVRQLMSCIIVCSMSHMTATCESCDCHCLSHVTATVNHVTATVNHVTATLTELEQSVVPWRPDKEEKRCMSCGRGFNIRRRKHHCRLCGDIICKDCSQFMTLSQACKLLSVYELALEPETRVSLSLSPPPPPQILCCLTVQTSTLWPLPQEQGN